MCMGDSGNDAATAKSRDIDRAIKVDEKRMAKEVKLLLLGAGESGKSTILKQMKLIHAAGFSQADKEQFRVIIFANMLQSLKAIIIAMDEYELSFSNEENEAYRDLVRSDRELPVKEPFPLEFKMPFASLWADKGVQAAVRRGNEFALHDNISYFFDAESIDRVFQKNYLPIDQDILRARMKTTGISETIFPLGALTYRMFDVGGQRSERKKWIHCFQNVTALLFLVAISGYDQCLVEDKDANQMQEALMLFESICNSQWFVNTSIILFLNKIDLFKFKLATSPVNKFFPEYEGDPTNWKTASAFFQSNFVNLNRNPAKEIYTHFTNATDTNLLKVTMASVQDMILQKNLQNLILL